MQSMWAMEQLPWKGPEWSLEEKVSKIVEAGYDGAAVEFDDPEVALRTTQLLREHGLKWSVECYPRTVEDLKPVLEDAYRLGIEGVTFRASSFLNLQGIFFSSFASGVRCGTSDLLHSREVPHASLRVLL